MLPFLKFLSAKDFIVCTLNYFLFPLKNLHSLFFLYCGLYILHANLIEDCNVCMPVLFFLTLED